MVVGYTNQKKVKEKKDNGSKETVEEVISPMDTEPTAEIDPKEKGVTNQWKLREERKKRMKKRMMERIMMKKTMMERIVMKRTVMKRVMMDKKNQIKLHEQSEEGSSTEANSTDEEDAGKIDSGEELFEDNSEDDDDHPQRPENMLFPPSEYVKCCRICSRCSVSKTVEYLR